MLNLNIIPNKLKKEIKLLKFYNIFRNILLIFVFISSVVGIIFLLGDAVLETYINNSGISYFMVQGNNKNLDQEIEKAEEKIDYVMNIQENAINWSKLFEDIMSKTNNNIVYSKVTVNRDKYQLNLFGRARNRSDLIDLRNKFENSDTYLTIDFPIQNILEKENIDFNMLMTVDPYDFK